MNNVSEFSDEFNEDVIEEIMKEFENFVHLIVKDETESYKYLTFFLNYVLNLDLKSPVFPRLIIFVRYSFKKLSELNFEMIINVIENYFVDFIIHNLKT